MFLKQPLILLDPNMLIPWDVINSLILKMKDYVSESPESARERWHAVFGAYVPTLDIQLSLAFVNVLEKLP